MAQNISDYIYEPLSDPASCIRLVTILPTGKDVSQPDTIRLSLREFSVHSCPPYQAVSYTLGDEVDQEYLFIHNGQEHSRLPVRRNCGDVLKQLAHFQLDARELYWIDAICINQKDIQEKGFQVAMMGNIFRQAQQVTICLGMSQGDDVFLANTLADLDKLLAFHDLSTAIFVADPNVNGLQRSRALQLTEQWIHALPIQRVVRLCQALDALAEVSYFPRIWTLQEMYMSRSITMYRGFCQLALSTILFAWHGFDLNHLHTGQRPALWQKLHSTTLRQSFLDAHSWRNRICGGVGPILGREYGNLLSYCVEPLNDGQPRVPMSLWDFIILCQSRSCEDRRDTMYGTLELSYWREVEEIGPDGLPKVPDPGGFYTPGGFKPDCDLSTFDLAKGVMLHFHQTSHIWRLVSMLRIHSTDIDVVPAIRKRREADLTCLEPASDARRCNRQHRIVHIYDVCIGGASRGMTSDPELRVRR